MDKKLLLLSVLVCVAAGAWWRFSKTEIPPTETPPVQEPIPLLSESCDDGDPCTIDRFHRFQKVCIHVPDALCTKACKKDGDCAYPQDKAPCMQAKCESGQCRYMKIARDECIRCDSENPCVQSVCDPRECENGFCRKVSVRCDDGDSATWDRCNLAKDACEHLLVDKKRACESDQTCTDDHPCWKFACVVGLCELNLSTADCSAPLNVARTCTQNTDCIQKRSDGCFAGPCKDGFCHWRKVENSDCKPCTGDHDCQEEASFCGWPICTGTVCTVETVPFCVDDNPNTKDSCSNEVQACLHRYPELPPQCVNGVRDDGDPQTVDVCDTESGKTLHLAAGEGPCRTSNRCWYTYEGKNGACYGHAIQCMHDDACEAHCDPDKGCVLDSAKDCHCKSDADCDLGSPCARVFCIDPGKNGACWGTFIDDCVACKSDNDCTMDSWCVFGRCSESGYCQYTEGVTCDDKNPNTFGFCHGQRDEPCTYEPIYNYIR